MTSSRKRSMNVLRNNDITYNTKWKIIVKWSDRLKTAGSYVLDNSQNILIEWIIKTPLFLGFWKTNDTIIWIKFRKDKYSTYLYTNVDFWKWIDIIYVKPLINFDVC